MAGDRPRPPATSATERVRRFAFGFTNLPLSWWELFKRTAKEFMADNGTGLAAQLAYYFFFSLFPAVLVGIAESFTTLVFDFGCLMLAWLCVAVGQWRRP